jgi:TRAP-type uncharacterized transport system substrate-binding protein
MTSTSQRVRRLIWKWVVPLVGVAALGVAVYAYFHAPRNRSFHLTALAGSTVSTRHQLAEMLRPELEQCGLSLEIRSSHGSEEALDLVNQGQIDLAFVQGGLGVGDRPNVRLVAMLQIEPLHLLVKKELADKVAERLAALDGKTVDIGEPATGTHTLAAAVLAFAGLTPHVEGKPGGYVVKELDHAKLTTAKRADLPDAIFLVASLPSLVTTHLVRHHGYQLVPLPFGEAFALSSLAEEKGQPHTSHTIDKAHTYATTIPAFTYGVEPPTPPVALPTLGTRLLVVANKDVDPRAIERMIECIYGSKFAQVIRPPLDAKMMDMPPELPWHDGAEAFRQSTRPLVSGDVLNLAQKGTVILGSVGSGAVVLWGWLRRRRQTRKGQEFRKLLNDVTRLDEDAMYMEESGKANVELLLGVRRQLAALRSKVLDRFAEGELDDNELMSSFLAHVNSSRDNLTRLIAQHRHFAGQIPTEGYNPGASIYGPPAEPPPPLQFRAHATNDAGAVGRTQEAEEQ